MNNKKYFCLVLHSHIPYVLNHGTWPHGLDWLNEAAAETYLPLLQVLKRLENEGYRANLTISFTPVLMEQLSNSAFKQGFVDYLTMKLEAAVNDYLYFRHTGQKEFETLALFWRNWYERISKFFIDDLHSDLLSAFRQLQDAGAVEITTSAATHGYFPLLARDESIAFQVQQGKHTYARYFGRQPAGFWLPECAYRPGYIWTRPIGQSRSYKRRGVDEILGQAGLKYFFVDAHLLKGGEAKGVYLEKFPALKYLWEKYKARAKSEPIRPDDLYQPYLAYPSGVSFLARDEVTGQQVWSRHSGYPGDGNYLEFHKKHFPGGHRYWKITSSSSDLADKLPYDPNLALSRVEEHARHFAWLLNDILKDREEGIITSLYDTELLGHWWFEGPEWLYQVVKNLNSESSQVKLIKASSALEEIPPVTMVSLPEGSWGEGGFHWIWFNDENSWIWSRIYEVEELFWNLVSEPELFQRTDPRLVKMLAQEKFLLESSDWPFLISTMTARDYAEARASLHYERAIRLFQMISQGTYLSEEDEYFLKLVEKEDSLFKEIRLPDGNIL